MPSRQPYSPAEVLTLNSFRPSGAANTTMGNVEHADKLIIIFGEWPSFPDAYQAPRVLMVCSDVTKTSNVDGAETSQAEAHQNTTGLGGQRLQRPLIPCHHLFLLV